MHRRGFALLIVLVSATPIAWAAQKAVVIVPVADLRSDQSVPEPGKSDNKQQTQLLFGETVEVVKSSGDWVYVNATEQPEFTTHQKWEGYPGWMLKSSLKLVESPYLGLSVIKKWISVVASPQGPFLVRLPLGSRLHVRNPGENLGSAFEIDLLNGGTGLVTSNLEKSLVNGQSVSTGGRRLSILITAELLLGDTYLWGGLSPVDETHKILLSGVDCSGLVHLSYRVNGYIVPRDSMEQYIKAEKIQRKDLKPADLIFSSKTDNPQQITHVALYAGGDQIIEAPQTGMVVRKISFKEKYGAEMQSVESGDRVGDRVIYFGRLVKD